jgi:hypothetical protein
MALKDRYAGRAQPTRLDTGAARGLMVCRMVRSSRAPRTA